MSLTIKRMMKNKFNWLIRRWRELSLPSWMERSWFKFGMGFATMLVAVAFVGKMSALSTAGYKMHDLENISSVLAAEIQAMRSEAAEYSALANIQARVSSNQMVAIKKVIYLNADGSIVAKR